MQTLKCESCEKAVLECECVDLPELEVANIYWLFNRQVENLARWVRAFGLMLLALCVVSEAKAAPVCAEKSDAYKLAVADMQGYGDKLWFELMVEGRCANIPVTYLWTLDLYQDSDKVTSRVVVYLANGTQFYGLRASLPENQNIWLIQHEGHPQDLTLHEKFYSKWLQPDALHNPRSVSCCDKKDCYPTTIKQVKGKWFAQRREDLAWIPIPEGKLEHNQSDPRESPDHQSHVCMQPPFYGDNVWCAVLGEAA